MRDPKNNCLHLKPLRSRWLLTPPLITVSDCCATVSVWLPPTTATTVVPGTQQVTLSHKISIQISPPRLDQCDKHLFFFLAWPVLVFGRRSEEEGRWGDKVNHWIIQSENTEEIDQQANIWYQRQITPEARWEFVCVCVRVSGATDEAVSHPPGEQHLACILWLLKQTAALTH